ncbi:MAG: DUF3667 domain-containing protein [Deltaproteobacteria bacterium]|nr:DUF3667 domain-containing protein [Deltaproteobacteria bacterium]
MQEVRGPIGSMLLELLADWISLDGRLLRSLKALALPGRLSRTYLDGKRAPYLRPMRFYFVASLALFSSLLSLKAPDASEVNLFIGGQLIGEGPAQTGKPNLTLFQNDSTVVRWLARSLEDPVKQIRKLPPQELLDSFFADLRRSLPLTLILFLPILALLMKLLYFRTGILYVDHLVVAAHLQTALFLALTVTWLLSRILGLSLFVSLVTYGLVGFLILIVYLPLALRHIYGQTRWLTGLKTVLLFYGYGKLLVWLLAFSMTMVILRLAGR